MSPAPTQIQHFRIERVLGRGGVGVVYLATDERLGRAVALKVLSDVELSDTVSRERFIREARVAASLRHPNIATIYEVGEASGTPFIAMEFCEGEPLSSRILRQPLTADEFLSVAEQIAAGLAAAHRGNVIHRDIKSANIMLEPDGSVKILDFGLAKLVQHDLASSHQQTMQHTSTGGSFFGTVPYISPEQARGLPADARSDLFATGVVFYELSSGTLPFEGDSPLSILTHIRDSEPAPFTPRDATFPPELVHIISRLLQKSPEDRYQSADELAADLAKVRAKYFTHSRKSRPVGASKTIPLRRTVRRAHLIPLVAVTILFLSVIGAVWYFRDDLARGAAPVPAASDGRIDSLAVLPFRNLSGANDDAFLSIGMADTLVTRLQQIETLQVRPTSAVLQFQNQAIDPKEAGARLNVEGVLEGRFLTAGQKVRINLQLTDSRTGYGIWAESIDGSRGDLLSLMDRVSNRAVAALDRHAEPSAAGSNASQPRTRNAEAFELYLRSRSMTGTLNRETYRKQIELLQSAITLDPKFAAAYADLAIALSLGQARGLGDGTLDGQNAEWFARQAVRLDPHLPEAHLALGRSLVRSPNRFSESVRENLAALRLNPNEQQALYTMVTYFVATGELSRAECVGERFIRVDPNSNDARTRGYWYVNAVDPDRATELAQEALASPETQLAGYDIAASAALARGDLAAAKAAQLEAAKLAPNHYIPKSLAAMIAAARGNANEASRLLETFETDAQRNHWAALRVALTHARLGNRKEAVDWIRRAVTLGNRSWYFLVRHPWLQPLQDDHEFQKAVVTVKHDLDDVRDDVIGVFEKLCDRSNARAS